MSPGSSEARSEELHEYLTCGMKEVERQSVDEGRSVACLERKKKKKSSACVGARAPELGLLDQSQKTAPAKPGQLARSCELQWETVSAFIRKKKKATLSLRETARASAGETRLGERRGGLYLDFPPPRH